MDLLVISNKSTSIPHIGFVIPNESKDVGSNAFMFPVLTKVVEELVQVSNIQILILQHFKIRGRVFSNWGRKMWSKKVLISTFRNLEDKIHLKGEWNVMTWVLDKLFEFSLVIK